jgi:UDP-N-acetylglucosamine acyltransferase
MIHQTAIVDRGAEIAQDVEIGPYCLIGNKVTIKAGTRLVAHVTVDGPTDIGENCSIHPFAALGGPPQDLTYQGEDTRCIIGSGNTIREYVTINRGTKSSGSTVIGNNNFIMAYSHIAHDCRVGNNIIMANCATLAGHVHMDDFAIMGGLSAAHQF